MTNLIELVKLGVDAGLTAAQADWRIDAGMVIAGILLGLVEWTRRRRKKVKPIAAKSVVTAKPLSSEQEVEKEIARIITIRRPQK